MTDDDPQLAHLEAELRRRFEAALGRPAPAPRVDEPAPEAVPHDVSLHARLDRHRNDIDELKRRYNALVRIIEGFLGGGEQ